MTLPTAAQTALTARPHVPDVDLTLRPQPDTERLARVYTESAVDAAGLLAARQSLARAHEAWIRQALWSDYLADSTTYGTYSDRVPEYMIVAGALRSMGLADDDLIVDVGAGPGDLDHYLRRILGWRGRYLPVDGTTGTDLANWYPNVAADWYVCVETIEHVVEPVGHRWAQAFPILAARGVVITTPNADVTDVLAADHTHLVGLTPQWFTARGYTARTATLNARGWGDTVVATRLGYDPNE